MRSHLDQNLNSLELPRKKQDASVPGLGLEALLPLCRAVCSGLPVGDSLFQ